jgi:hypothetical protein
MCQLCSYFFHYFSSEKTGILRDTHIPAYPYVSPSWCSILHCNPRWPCWAPEVFEVQLSDWVHNLHIHRRPGQSLLPDRSSQTKKNFDGWPRHIGSSGGTGIDVPRWWRQRIWGGGRPNRAIEDIPRGHGLVAHDPFFVLNKRRVQTRHRWS